MKSNFIYLDYQASTPVCDEALEAMIDCYRDKTANPHSTQHIAGINSFQKVEKAKHEISDLINCQPNAIIFTSGATEANNLVFNGISHLKDKRNKILISAIEHKCVLETANYLADQGFEIELIPVNKNGLIETEKFKNMLDERVLIVSVIYANNEIGTIQNIKELAQIIKPTGAFFHTDAAQAPVTSEIDFDDIDLDFLSLSAHKMYGPKGIGALIVSAQAQRYLKPIIHGGGQQGGFRSGTLPTELCVGFGKAAKYIQDNLASIKEEIAGYRNFFYESLSEKLPDIKLVGPELSERHVGNLNIYFPGVDADTLLGLVQTEVGASTGSACTSGSISQSHVLENIGFNAEESSSCIRFSFGIGMDIIELKRAVKLIKDSHSILFH